jgi:trehalose-phosphatase
MQSFWTARSRVEASLRAGVRVVLLSDFDGTLAPLVSQPGRARLPARARRALRCLGGRLGFSIGIVSGRSLADIRRRAKVGRAAYVGSHGMEYVVPGERPVRLVGREYAPLLRQLRKRVQRLLAKVRGLRWELKPCSAALHYRRAGSGDVPGILSAAGRAEREFRPAFRLQRGKKVVEFLPNVGASKATAVRAILSKIRGKSRDLCIPVYFGDDLTDEPVFREVRGKGWTVKVGRSRAPTAARYYLRSPAEVGRWLEWLGRCAGE